LKRIAEAGAARLAEQPGNAEPFTAEEVFRLLARIARTEAPAARLRAIELLGSRMELFQAARDVGRPTMLSDDERTERIAAILERARLRQVTPVGLSPESQ